MGRIFLFLLTPGIHYTTNTRTSSQARLFYIALMLFLIGMTQSKSAWIFTILYLSLAVLLNLLGRFSNGDKHIAVGFTVIAISVASVLVITNFGEILLLFGRDATLSGRTGLWKVLLVSIAKRPWVGYGYQAFWAGPTSEAMNAALGSYYLLNRFTGTYAHSGYVAVLLDDGIVGLGVIVLLVVKAGKDAMLCVGRAHTPIINWYIGIVVLTLLYNIDEVTFMLPSYLPWMMFLLAVIGLSKEGHRIRSQRFA
jgi:O-antigen ligase